MPHPLQPDHRVHGVVVAIPHPINPAQYLTIRRSAHVELAPLKVCFPGGGVELNESQQEAIIREMHEELNVLVLPLQHLWTHHFPDRPLTLFGWLAHLAPNQTPTPNPAEIAEIFWMTPQQISTHPQGLPTNPHFAKTLPLPS